MSFKTHTIKSSNSLLRN